MKTPPYKQITSYCTSGNVVRDDLISEWYTVTLEDNSTVQAYYHLHHGWMIKGEVVSNFTYGYIPLNKKVIKW